MFLSGSLALRRTSSGEYLSSMRRKTIVRGSGSSGSSDIMTRCALRTLWCQVWELGLGCLHACVSTCKY